MRTKERLAEVLEQAGLPDMARSARNGEYDDYESKEPFPLTTLIRHLVDAGQLDLAKRAMAGEWDGTKEEAEAWFARKGKFLLKK